MKIKKYLIDISATIVFWTPFYIVYSILINKNSIDETLQLAIYVVIINLLFGGVFGMFIDLWRRLLKVKH